MSHTDINAKDIEIERLRTMVSKVREDALEAAAQIADSFRCGACGVDGKAAAAIRLLARQPSSFSILDDKGTGK